MTRQALRLFSLLFFVLLMQWGGAAHAVSHLDDDHDHKPHTACELCVAYSAFDHSLVDTTAKMATPELAHATPLAAEWPARQPATTRHYLSRAPPSA